MPFVKQISSGPIIGTETKWGHESTLVRSVIKMSTARLCVNRLTRILFQVISALIQLARGFLGHSTGEGFKELTSYASYRRH